MGPVQAREVLGSEGLCPWFNSLDAVWKFFLSAFFAGCAGSSLLCGLPSSRGEQGALSSLRAHASHRRGSWAELPRGMWNVSRPGMEPVSPALPRQILNHGTTGETLP